MFKINELTQLQHLHRKMHHSTTNWRMNLQGSRESGLLVIIVSKFQNSEKQNQITNKMDWEIPSLSFSGGKRGAREVYIFLCSSFPPGSGIEMTHKGIPTFHYRLSEADLTRYSSSFDEYYRSSPCDPPTDRGTAEKNTNPKTIVQHRHQRGEMNASSCSPNRWSPTLRAV